MFAVKVINNSRLLLMCVLDLADGIVKPGLDWSDYVLGGASGAGHFLFAMWSMLSLLSDRLLGIT